MIYIIVFILGAIIGSFLNVCIYRLPRQLSIAFPPSSCPNCGRRIQPLELIPMVSFIWLRGKCKGCDEPISLRYPLVEALTGLLFVWGFIQGGFSWETAKYWVFIGLIMPITFIDLEHQIIPNVLSVPGVLAGIVLTYLTGGLWWESLAGAVLGFGIIVAIIILSRGGMGWGDSKLLAMIGAFWGMRLVFFSLILGSFIGCIVGIYLMVAKGANRKTAVPFGPFLAGGAVLSLELLRHFPSLVQFFPW